jgi:tetratricopeptide (TPR) repeat protein
LAAKAADAVAGLSPRELILLPHSGDSALDQQIAALQKRIAGPGDAMPLIEKLGRLFIAKARTSSDPGYYKMAEQCALAVLAVHAEASDALLLRGHVLGALHRFREAEEIARRLVSQRENFLDHALLGDALMEQGRLDEAVAAYQTMIDLRPGMQSYCRVAHVRWLKGDLEGAIDLLQQAVQTGTARDPEPMAWAYSRLALYQLENGSDGALGSADRALQLVPGYAAALLARGRILLAQGNFKDALEPLKAAAARSPLPEYLWALADGLRVAGENDEAAIAEAKLERSGAVDDPRTFALYLATRKLHPARALELAQAELKERSDIHTHDALAWASWAAGEHNLALEHSRKALAEGTHDPRLLLHAGLIAAAADREEEAQAFLQKATARRQMLLPSEAALLDLRLTAFANDQAPQRER